MKALIAAVLMIVSVSTFSAEMGSVDSLLSVLPVGSYQGQDDAGNACNVIVNDVNYPAKALSITVSNNKSTIFKIINDGSEFLFRAYKKEFIQTERQYVDSTRSSYVDRIIRTVIGGDNTLYVVVANELTVNRDRTVESVECVIKL
ncbi:MAG: hypothetical protein H7336_16050 [Bacteriovorax sp.]|nr:hypothetical protein [Bacteriovorax sp.]